MTDWTREVEHHASSSLQYVSPGPESEPLITEERREAKHIRIFWIVFLISVLCVGVCIGAYLLTKEGPWPVLPPYILMRNAAWRGHDTLHPAEPLDGPVGHLVITESNSEACESYRSCVNVLRKIEYHHVRVKLLAQIAYNFLVSGNGVVYEGRGWGRQPEMVDAMDDDALVFALIGRFHSLAPPTNQILELKLLIAEAMERGALRPCHKIMLYLPKKPQLRRLTQDLLEDNRQLQIKNNCTA